MNPTRTIISLSLTVILTACGARSFGGAPDDGSVQPDRLALVYDAYGYITLTHHRTRNGNYPQEGLSLQASFHATPWDVYAPHFGWPDPTDVVTPDGVECEIRYVSGMDGPMPPDPPEALDGGIINAWGEPFGDQLLGIGFVGGGYDSDYRSPSGAALWPDWMRDSALPVMFSSGGSEHAAPFVQELTLADMPVILSPPESLDEPLTPGPDGNYAIVWGPVEADRTEVIFTFNLDWDDSYFRCYPEPDRTAMSLPHEWLQEYTWGYGEMMVLAVNEQTIGSSGAEIVLRTMRAAQQSLNVDVWE